jgi:cytochrome d ubiquinol oxidase subunit II
MRGVPLRPDGYFFEALWTNFRVGPDAGILDWYTVMTGFLAFAALSLHGSLYVALKTDSAISNRARRVAALAWPVVVLLTVAGIWGTLYVHPGILGNFQRHPWGWCIPVIVLASLVLNVIFIARQNDLAAFLSSVAYLTAMLAGAAFAIYPNLLPSITDPAYALTIYNSQTGSYSLHVGLIWWTAGMALAVAYFVFLYSSFRRSV